MTDELWNEFQKMVLGCDDPELFIPYGANASVVDRNRLSRETFKPQKTELSSCHLYDA